MAVTIEQLIKLNHDLRETLLARWQMKKPFTLQGKSWPLLFLATQVINLHEAIELLSSKGFGREAGILLRSMFETTVNIIWIVKDPLVRLERFTAYGYFTTEQYRDMANSLPGNEKTIEEQEKYDKDSQKVREDAKKAKEKYGFKKNQYWSGITLRSMAEEINWLPRYKTIYKIYSDVIHSSIGSHRDYVSQHESGAIFIHRKPIFHHALPVLSEAYCYLAFALGFVDAWVELGIEKELDAAMQNVNKILSGDLEHLEEI